jgi:hypothetical protein
VINMARKLFEKGSPKLPNSGRKKNTPNKKTVEQREAFETIMHLLEKRMTNDMDVINSLTPSRAAEVYTNLLNYKKPKLSSNRNEDSVEHSGEIKININYSDDFNSVPNDAPVDEDI